jgi:hypothetical protein
MGDSDDQTQTLPLAARALSLRKNDPGSGLDGRDEIAGLGHQVEGHFPERGSRGLRQARLRRLPFFHKPINARTTVRLARTIRVASNAGTHRTWSPFTT